jgi:class 3 adenylate cyclase
MVEMMMNGEVDTSLGGKDYEGTVFFSDIIGFTHMSESMEPEQVVANLNRYFTVMQKILYDNGGNVDKFGGDAIMAFWSVPHHDTNDELNAILTGVQMQANLWPFNRELEADGETVIHMGIGINTGSFVAGNIGSKDKIEFTLIGDNVNLAARIEAKAGRWQVFVAESTWTPAKERVTAILLPPVMVKGKSEPINIYSIRLVQVGENECALAIPCSIRDESGAELATGVLTGTWNLGDDQRLLLNTMVELPAETNIELHLEMPEYHTPFSLSARVATTSASSQGGKATYQRVVLADLKGEEALAFLKPGNCLKTEQPWENIQRGS